MATTYNLEPPPTGKVLLQTTSGDIELELFAKQTPITCRNFMQLCLDGYYDGTIFHRVVPGFVIQGGDPTGTGDGGESIYPEGPFADEFHSRLKFNRRGLLGMANSGRKDDNGSQFFLTLGKTEGLNNTNTLFGRVAGDTIYNVIRMGEADLADSGSERPLYPTKITGAEILVNPFADMVKRELKPHRLPETKAAPAKKKSKKKGGKAFLSFAGGDAEEDGDGPVIKKAKFNTKLVEAGPTESNVSRAKTDEKTSDVKSETPRRKGSRSLTPQVRTPAEHKAQLPLPDEERPSHSPSSSPERDQTSRYVSSLDKTNAEIAKLKASMKRTTMTAPSEVSRKKTALEELIPQHAIRGRKRKQGDRNTTSSETQAMDMLKAFRAKLESAAPKVQQIDVAAPEFNHDKSNTEEGDDDTEEASLCDLHFIANCQSCRSWDKEAEEGQDIERLEDGWMSHALNFGKDRLGKDLNWKKKNEEDLVVIDPREKAKVLRDEPRSRKSDRGRTGRSWDVDRDRGKLPERPAGRQR